MMELMTLSNLEKVRTLPTTSLHEINYSLQKYLYSAGVNIGFHTAFHNKQSVIFQNKIAKAIEKQILLIASTDKIYDVIRYKEKLDDKNILLTLGTFWLVLNNAMDKGDAVILNYLIWAGGWGGQVALDKMVPDRTFVLKNELIKSQLADRMQYLIKTVDKTSQKWVADVIEKGYQAGWDTDRITLFLKENAKKIAMDRAQIITETELMNAMNLVELEAFKKNNIAKHKWITQVDEKVCAEICMANEAAGSIKVGGEFPGGTEKPPGHILCRCYLIPILPEYIKGKLWTGE
jgi:SPP1 gp7 family putative phage head morphogenesis protein